MIGGRYVQRGGNLGNIAEGKLPAGCDMLDHMVARSAILGVDAPHIRRGGFEHQPRRGAGHAHRLIELPHAARPIGVLITVFRIALGLNDPDTHPVGFELVGEDHRQSGANPGAHFRPVGHDRHQPGLVDSEIDIGVKGLHRRRLGERERTRSDMKAEH